MATDTDGRAKLILLPSSRLGEDAKSEDKGVIQSETDDKTKKES